MIPLFQPTISVPILQFGQLNQYTATIILHNLVFDPNRHALGEHWSSHSLLSDLDQQFKANVLHGVLHAKFLYICTCTAVG